MSQSEFNKTKVNISQEDRCVYYAYLCSKKPQKVCQLSRKELKYKQRMILRREKGDEFLASMKWVDIMNAQQVAEMCGIQRVTTSSLRCQLCKNY